jgi:hypothetical protein
LASVATTTLDPMTQLEQRILEFARANRPLHEAREEFGWRPVTYVQALYRLLDRADVVAWDPVEVHRLQRLREKRRERFVSVG